MLDSSIVSVLLFMLAPISAPPGAVGGREASVGSMSPPLIVVVVVVVVAQQGKYVCCWERAMRSCARGARSLCVVVVVVVV